MRKAGFISALKQTRPKVAMHIERSIDNTVNYLVLVLH